MQGKHHYRILCDTHNREEVLEHARENGVNWETNSHEGVNWMRAGHAIVNHIDQGNQFDTEHTDPETAQQMLGMYQNLRESHKKTMIPHLRSAMSKIYADSDVKDIPTHELIDMAHEHLKANGGPVWAEKLNTLSHFNTQIEKLSSKIPN